MTWLPLLLSDSSATLRYLVLKELLEKPEDDEELLELEKLRLEDPILTSLLNAQKSDGSWESNEMLGLLLGDVIENTAQAMCRLGYLGFNRSLPAIHRAAEFLFEQQLENGAWPRVMGGKLTLKHPSHGIVISPRQIAFPLEALAICGYAMDKRVEKGFDYLINLRAPDGSWPPYISPEGKIGYQLVGYRQMPNSRFGCRTNSTSALTALSYHPNRRKSEEAQKALDLLLARETRDRSILGFEAARNIGIEPAQGYLTYYARYDVSFILELAWRIGASSNDPRVKDIINYLKEEQGVFGLWEYQPKPQATRWITFNILRSLSKIDASSNWISTEPRTKYHSYPKKPRRY